MLSVRLPMVIFTDEESIVKHVYKTRFDYGLIHMTFIIRLPFEETFFYKDIDVLKQRMEEFKIVNWNKDKDTPMYVLLNNNKFDFLKRTMEINPYNSEFFFWMDMGIQHCTEATEKEWSDISEVWPAFIQQDKSHIHQLRISTVLKPDDMSWKDYFRMIYHNVAGGMFGGHKDMVEEYITLFKDQWHKIIHEEKWWQLDEAIMTIITETYPEKFRFFHGDYDGLLSNFIKSKKSFPLVAQTSKRYLDANNYNLADSVLSAVDFDCLIDSEYYGMILSLKFCADYYSLQGRMSPMLVEIINRHQIPVDITQILMPNLRYIFDERAVPFFVKWILNNPENNWALEKWKNIPDHHSFEWVNLEKSSKEFLSKKPLPFDTIDDDPVKLLAHFHSQFSSFPTEETTSLYEILETPDKNLLFFWNTPSFLKQGPEKQELYDQSILKLCGFLKRNFPQLKFYMICLYADSKWSIPIHETPDELIVFYYETPYFFGNNDITYYNKSIQMFVKSLTRKVLFINHKEKQCGVHQYGKRLYDILKKCKMVQYEYREIQNVHEYFEIIDNNRYDIVIYNYRDTTMPWLNQHTIRRTQTNIAIPHENDPSFFDKIISIDPDEKEKTHFYNIPRPIFEDIPAIDEPCDNNNFQEFVSYRGDDETPIFGSFGFGFTNKGFIRIIEQINHQYDKAIIKFVMPPAHFGGNMQTIQSIKDQCLERVTKPGITFLMSTEFISEHDLLLFLRSNTMNMFMYDKRPRDGISSTIDYALSVRRPLGISDSHMFRNIYSDDICIYKNPIQKCMENSVAHCEKFLSRYSHQNTRNKFLHIFSDP
jgi:hypothetical protein